MILHKCMYVLVTLKGEVQCSMYMLIHCHGAVVSTFPDSFYVRQFSFSLKAIILALKFNILQGTKTVTLCVCVYVCVCVCVCVCVHACVKF